MKKNCNKFIADFRKRIPKKYNNCELLDFLMDENIDHYLSISNRADGKSFNYIDFFIQFALEYDIKFFLIGRHYTIRNSYASLLMKIYDKEEKLNINNLVLKRTDDYIIVLNKDKPISVISDLNNATDLKYHSNFLQEFPIIIYDEFLALDSDYLPDEYERMKVIYETIDRNGDIPYIKYPKIFYLGNAVNFTSPILSRLGIFRKLENHKINTIRVYDNKCLEMRKNEHANDSKNMRAFDSQEDAMNTGEFTFNNYNIATDTEIQNIRKTSKRFNIDFGDYLLKVEFDNERNVLLKIIPFENNYLFTYNVNNLKNGVYYLKENFFSENHIKKYQKGIFLYEDAFSKQIISDSELIMSLKIQKCISLYIFENREKDYSEELEEKYIYNKNENVIKNILKQYDM